MTCCAVWASLVAAVAFGAPALGQPNCAQTSVGLTPITEMGGALYLGEFAGGLYPGGQNVPPAAHAAEGLARAGMVTPLDVLGQPDPGGKYVLLSIGMSNTTQEYCGGPIGGCQAVTFMGQAAASPFVNHGSLAIVDGAAGGQSGAAWITPASPNYDRVRDTRLAPQGLSELQVQVIWIKQANPGPGVSLPSESADAYVLMQHLGDTVRAAKARYPNLRLVFLSSRIYAGYASVGLNPEPYAYESAFAVKWLIQSQISQMSGGPAHPRAGNLDYGTAAPLLLWGPYLWADGLTARGDGLVYECADMASDGTHPWTGARRKVGTMLYEFMLGSPFAEPWFRDAAACAADWDRSGLVNSGDISAFLTSWLRDQQHGLRITDVDGSGAVNSGDITAFLGLWLAAVGGGCPS